MGQNTATQSLAPASSVWRKYVNAMIAAEISTLTRYCDAVYQFAPREHDELLLLEAIEAPCKQVINSLTQFPESLRNDADRSVILLNANFNHEHDIELLLRDIKRRVGRGTRVIAVSYNPYLRGLYQLANRYGIRRGEEPCTFVTGTDLENIAALAEFEVVRLRPIGFTPFAWAGMGDLLNRVLSLIPLVRWMGVVSVVTLRPIVSQKRPSLTVVIPARNERGNIEAALQRMPDFGGAELEVLFVEGHSTDNTWEEIQRVVPLYSQRFSVRAFRQTGKGKSDAVRLGFREAKHELLTILDADLTMPPELLPRFYEAYTRGLADFVNGSRLVYPMEGQAMKFLNRLGNVFFAKALSTVLESRIGDSLCGTKLVSRRDYERFGEWRRDFGDFDPFGDFELLFPAAILGLGVIDVPIRYRDRVYGTTNIRRFYHGWMLLKMTVVGLLRVKLPPAVKPVAVIR